MTLFTNPWSLAIPLKMLIDNIKDDGIETELSYT